MCEGFEIDNYIDIFDGGLILYVCILGICLIVQSWVVLVKIGEVLKSGCLYLVINGQLQDFCVVVLDLDWVFGKLVVLSVEVVEVLGVGEGVSVCLVVV